jgi:excisionase family DNA binding protein
MNAQQDWFTPEELAEWLRVPEAAVHEAISSGEITAYRLGGHIRIDRAAFLESVAAAPDTPISAPLSAADTAETNAADTTETATHLPPPPELAWVAELRSTDLPPYRWPPEPDGERLVTTFDEAWAGRISLRGVPHRVAVGADYMRSKKHRSDKPDRLIAFIDGRPVAEFIETGGDPAAWASLIKVADNSSLHAREQLPDLYKRAKVAPYADVTGGRQRGRSNGLAVVIARDDVRSAVHHAAAKELARSLADQVRQCAVRRNVEPARHRGESQVTITSGEIHRDLGLTNRLPLVCAALGSKKFEKQYGITLLHTTGGNQGANVQYTFNI